MLINLTIEGRNYKNFTSTTVRGFNTEYMSNLQDNHENTVSGNTKFTYIVEGSTETYFVTETKEAISLMSGAAVSGVISVKKTISIIKDDSTTDYSYDNTESNQTEQVIELIDIVPAFARVIDVVLICTSNCNLVVSTKAGSTSGNNNYFTAANNDDLNDISAVANNKTCPVTISATDESIYIASTPTADWDTGSKGKWKVIVTYIDTL